MEGRIKGNIPEDGSRAILCSKDLAQMGDDIHIGRWRWCDSDRAVPNREDVLLIMEGRVQEVHLAQAEHCSSQTPCISI